MSNPPDEKKPTAVSKLGVLLQPKNLLKTVASQVPIASAGVEMLNQLDGEMLAQRIGETETQLRALRDFKAPARPPSEAPLREWSYSASEYLTRTVDLAVVYDGGYHARADKGRALVQTVGHGCLIADREVLTCKEALEMVLSTAKHKGGRAIVVAGMSWYAFDHEQPNPASGVCICRLTERDETRWQQLVAKMKQVDMAPVDLSTVTPVRFTITPWIGQEVGFLHAGEAKDISLRMDAFSRLQFDASVISHFRKFRVDGLKTFTTGVLGGRIMLTGSPVFSRDGTLLGVLSGTEAYEADAGRRAIVRSLLGHPRYMPTGR